MTTAQNIISSLTSILTTYSSYASTASNNYQSNLDEIQGISALGTTLKSAITTQSKKQAAYDAQSVVVATARANCTAAYNTYLSAQSSKETGQTKLESLTNTYTSIGNAEKALTTEQKNLTDMKTDGATSKQQIYNELYGKEISLNGKNYILDTYQATALSNNTAIALENVTYTLKNLSELAKIKTNISKTETTCRQNAVYDWLGRLQNYDEISFTGHEN